jgi:predicted GH43/DUF377 family glycosyl hydrolase
MKWIKKSLILSEATALGFGIANTQVPFAIKLNKKIRIFFGAREKIGGPAGVYYIDVRSDQPDKILYVHGKPILNRGKIGSFDQDGVLPVCIKKIGTDFYMYYGGFSKMASSAHFCMMGLAISKDDGKSFLRISEGPTLPISRIDPILIGSADIVYDDGIWHMIYTSGTKWSNVGGSMEISYTLKYSYSKDGIDWVPTGHIVLPQETDYDAYAKPSIFRYKGKFVMYFSKRQIINYREKGVSAYSLGYATSDNLIDWVRDDNQAGIEASTSGWDSEMICYPNVIEIDGRYLMFYNGNGFGRSGIGYAELATD